jgi:hypothetical protein
MTDPGTVWTRLDTLTDDELATLVAAARSVLVEQGGADEEDAALPAGPAGAAIAAELAADGEDLSATGIAALLRDEAAARSLAEAVLREIGSQPELARLVAEAYEARRQMLAIDAGLVLAGALLVLVLKLKRIKIGKLDISFYEARESTVAHLRSLLGK